MWSGPQEFTREMTNVETIKKTSRQRGVSGTWAVSAVMESFLSNVPGAELEGRTSGRLWVLIFASLSCTVPGT